jgi:DNA repair protein RecO (recombination protein O)
MAAETVEAVVLATRPYGESHRIVTLLTRRSGVIGAMAHGAEKQQSPLAGTRALTHGLFLIRRRGQGLADLVQAEILSQYPRTRADIKCSAYAQAVLELALVLGRQLEPARESPLGDEIMAALERLEQGAPVRLTLAHLFARLPGLAGLSIAASRCAACARPLDGLTGLRFAPSAGGLVCPACGAGSAGAASSPWSAAAARAFAAMMDMPLARGLELGTEVVADGGEELILRTLVAYWAEFGGVVLKSWPVIMALDSLGD